MALPNPGWNVVYGEIPAASKWSQLGANDDALAAGTGLNDLAIATAKIADAAVTGIKIGSLPGQTQQDTTNSAKTNLRMQMGIGRIAGVSATEIAEAVTFPVAFSARPFVLANAIGFVGAGGSFAPASIDGSWAGQHANANAPTVTGFTARMRRNDGSPFGVGTDYYYSWIAIGEA